MNQFSKSTFTENLLTLNRLTARGFKTWLLKPGMGFADPGQWWGPCQARPTLHEGLDLDAFRDKDNNVQRLPADTIVPPLYAGRLVKIIDDFLGRTVIVEHGLSNRTGHILHGFYAHLATTDPVKIGAVLNEHAGLGTIAAGNRTCPSHLHISTVWIARNFPLEQFSWTDFTEQEDFQPCDPLIFL